MLMPVWLQVIAQSAAYKVAITPLDSSAATYKYQQTFANRIEATDYFENLPALMQSQGYWAVSIDSLMLDSLQGIAHIFAGDQYRIHQLLLPADYQTIFAANPKTTRKKQKEPERAFENYRQELLDYFEENGFPFAKVSFDSVSFGKQGVSAKVRIDKGNIYKIDSFFQGGSLRMKPAFLHRYLDLPKGAPYQRSKLDKIEQRLNELSFASPEKPWDISMLNTGAVVNLYLQPRRSNILNVLLGVMPASTQTPDNKVLITGEANILLRNSFRVGETIGVNWEQIQYLSPRLNLMYEQPYLFGSKAGVDFFFELFKKDTQFVNLQIRLGMPYQFSLNQSGKILLLRQQTTVTTTDTNFVLANKRLPDLASTSATSLGIDYTWNTTDYRINPRKGTDINFSALGGTKTLQRNANIEGLKDPNNPGINFGELYDSLKLNTFQARVHLNGAHYLPLTRSTVLKVGLQAGWYESGNYFRNELFQIGGYKLLRGFDEESIFARNFAVATIEYRLLSGRNSYFFGFADAGYAQYKDQILQIANSYIGTGLGLALETKNSIINLSWAIGKRNDLPLDLRQSKIHLGLINFF